MGFEDGTTHWNTRSPVTPPLGFLPSLCWALWFTVAVGITFLFFLPTPNHTTFYWKCWKEDAQNREVGQLPRWLRPAKLSLPGRMPWSGGRWGRAGLRGCQQSRVAGKGSVVGYLWGPASAAARWFSILSTASWLSCFQRNLVKFLLPVKITSPWDSCTLVIFFFSFKA